ncbi:MAG: transporter, Spinster family, sphingosine-phosphate transporter [Thermoanaerobaculia bacterium]|jgi:MFS family permease|nr:transporter, Spinster family, sphingosine-phosphate transporter [Thermoanaerobaculia bacterium]
MSVAIDSPAAQRAARYALAILTLINLFNYLDRWVVASVLESIKKSELHPSDTQLGLLGTGFLIVYTLTSPLFGSLGDRRKRPPLIALGVAVWSVATSLAGFARSFTFLFVARSTVGVGEAAYGTIAPAILADYFPIERRGRVLAVFFCAIPIGSAAAYILGGLVDQHFGWRAAFWIAGAPGLVLALLVMLVKDPPRGLHDVGGEWGVGSGESENESNAADSDSIATSHTPHPTPHSPVQAYRDLFRNRQFILTALGYGAYTFALGGLGYWMPAFLERIRGMPRSEATVTFGVIAVVTGFVGTFAGGFLGDFFLKRSKQSYLWVSGIATLIAAPAAFIAVSNPHRSIYLPAIAIAEVFIFMCTGPVNSAIINAVKPGERATAVGLSVLVMHVVGDIPSPPLIGAVSDHSSLERAFMLVPLAIVIAGVIWMYAAWQGREA